MDTFPSSPMHIALGRWGRPTGLARDGRGRRAIGSFLRYLRDLSPRHQQHWQTHLAFGRCKLENNYARRGLFGEWTEGVSVYEALLQELFHINKICQLIGLPLLFREDFSANARSSEEEPKGFGLLLKTTKKAFLDFAHVLDKITSENINADFFAVQGVELDESTTKKGQIVVNRKGTIRLLEEWLTRKIRIKDQNGAARIVAPLKEIRRLRQGPAHKFVGDELSLVYQTKKEQLILDLYISISNIRMFFQTHPRAVGYTFPSYLKAENIVVF